MPVIPPAASNTALRSSWVSPGLIGTASTESILGDHDRRASLGVRITVDRIGGVGPWRA